MADGKPPSNTDPKQSQAGQNRQKSRISGYLSGKPKPMKTAVVDPVQERKRRLTWWLKWVLLVPLAAYSLVWFLVIIIDLFK